MRIIDLHAKAGFRLYLRFNDEVSGEVDLSDLSGKGIFSIWQQAGVFDQARITEAGAVEWPGEIDLCPDALYLRLTGKKPEEVFPSLRRISTHA